MDEFLQELNAQCQQLAGPVTESGTGPDYGHFHLKKWAGTTGTDSDERFSIRTRPTIRDDFKKSVQDSYDQALECAEVVASPNRT
jgi:hypothetical protein